MNFQTPAPKPVRQCLLALALAAALSPAQADILAGQIGSLQTLNTVSRFDDSQSGNVPPAGVLGGPGSTLTDAGSLYYDDFAGELWVSDFFGQQVAVFDIGAEGQTAPKRRFNSPGMGQPRTMAIVGNRSEVAVITSLCCITFYPYAASGPTAPLRNIAWGGGGGSQTELNNPNGMAYSSALDRLWVADSRAVNGVSKGRVLVFDRLAGGTAPPLAVLEGPLTEFGGAAAAVAIDEAGAEIYVLAADAFGGPGAFAVSVFGLGQTGNVAPRRRIAGLRTGLANASDLSLDVERRELIVASGAYSSTPTLQVFPIGGDGDIAPVRTISGAAAGAGGGWYAVHAVPPRTLVFRSGFEAQ